MNIKNKLIIITIIIVGIFLSLRQYYIIQEEKQNKKIIDYCENIRWRINDFDKDFNFFESDDLTCEDFLDLKPTIKKSSSSICHDENSTYYYRTKTYKTYDTMDDCIKSGGRKPYN